MTSDECNFYFSFGLFLPFYPTKSPKNQYFKTIKQTPRDIILRKCTINYNHMICGSCHVEHDRQNVFNILGQFLSFYLH